MVKTPPLAWKDVLRPQTLNPKMKRKANTLTLKGKKRTANTLSYGENLDRVLGLSQGGGWFCDGSGGACVPLQFVCINLSLFI